MENSPQSSKGLGKDVLDIINKDFVIVGKTRVHGWHAWLALGLMLGLFMGVTLVVQRGNFEFSSAQDAGTLSINFFDVHQRIDGFGAADPWNPALTDAQADLFFSQTNGIGLSILRVGIDTNGEDKSAYSNATKAAVRGAIVWGVPFSAPGAWKDNGTSTNGGHLLPAFYDAWATRLAGFAATLQQNAGVPLYGLSVQNEPDWTATWDTMLYTNQEMLDFVKVLGPKIAALSPRPKLMLPEPGSWGLTWGFTSAVLGDSTAAPYLDIINAHQYGGISTPQTTAKPIWETEMSSFEGFDPSIGNGLMVASWIHDAITTGNASAWHYWWLIGLNSDNEGLIGYNSNTTITKRLYTMGNFSKFVRPGFFRVGTTGGPGGVSITAYKNPTTDAFVIVAINPNGSNVPLDVALNGLNTNSVTPWVTSANLDLAQQSGLAVSGGAFSATLSAQSVTTFVSGGTTPTPTPTPTPTDTTPPVVSVFNVQPRTGNQANRTVSWSFTDTGGSFLSRAEIQRATYNSSNCSDTNKTGCVWVLIKTVTAPTNVNNWSSSTSVSQPKGTYWYGIQALDKAGNRGYEPTLIKVVR